MSHDIYPSLSGASAAWRHLEVISNNLSNTSTNGYKEQRLSFETALISEGPLGEGYVAAAPTEQDFSDGRLVSDNVTTHMALSGRGFFLLEDGSLTRAGDFMLDQNNFLVTPDGQKVVGNNGPIQVLLNSEMRVRMDGTILLTERSSTALPWSMPNKLSPSAATAGARTTRSSMPMPRSSRAPWRPATWIRCGR
jgi:flagellar basal-body rod protein FlgG